MPVVDMNGAKLDVVSCGEGPDLVLLHSLLADRTAFDRVAPALARNRRVWLVNLPGYGESAPAGNTIDDYANCVAGLFPALGLSQHTAVLGNGFGGFIATALAIRHGEKFGRLIVADALVAFPEPAKEPLRMLASKVRQEGMSAALDTAIRRMFPETFAADHPAIVEERRRALEKADPECFATACIALTRVDFGADLRAIRNPTLVMAGALDATTPAALVRELAGGIRNARFLEIPGCGHCPQIEKPGDFTAAVEAFLSESE